MMSVFFTKVKPLALKMLLAIRISKNVLHILKELFEKNFERTLLIKNYFKEIKKQACCCFEINAGAPFKNE
jgi:hypothetical protein